MMKIKISKRLFCALLTVFLVLPTLLAGTLLKTSAADVTYTVIGASSGSIEYVGKDYRDGSTGRSLSFELNSGFTMQSSDGITYYATCVFAGAKDPPIGTQFTERFGINSRTLSDGLLQGAEKGAHYVVNAKNGHDVSSSAPNFDPTVGSVRQVDADFAFSCWYWGYQYQNNYSGVTFDNNLLQEAIAIAYRYEWDTRLIKYGNTYHKWDGWNAARDDMYTYWQRTPYDQWKIDTTHFNGATTNANIVEAANAILDAAITDPVTPTLEDGTMTYTGSDGTEYEMFALTGPQRPGDTRHYQDLLLFRAVSEPTPGTLYTIRIYKYPEGAEHDVTNTRETLAGAKFDLYKQVGGDWVYQKSLTTFGGTMTVRNNFENLEAGEYYVVETEAPEGYELDDTKHYVSLPDDVNNHGGGVATVILYLDNPKPEAPKYTIRIYKYPEGANHDVTNTRETLAGAKFDLYKQIGIDWVYQRSLTTIGGAMTVMNNFDNLEAGEYYVVETAPPEGYELDDTKHKVTGSDDRITWDGLKKGNYYFVISAHTSHEGMRLVVQNLWKISIHVPREGGATTPPTHPPGAGKFQSTHPARGCDRGFRDIFSKNFSYFNPRTPRGGATSTTQRSTRTPTNFNPRTPRGGATRRRCRKRPRRRYFNPRTPRGGAT